MTIFIDITKESQLVFVHKGWRKKLKLPRKIIVWLANIIMPVIWDGTKLRKKTIG